MKAKLIMVALSALSDEGTRKKVITVVLTVLVILFMPIIFVLGFSSSEITIDYGAVKDKITNNFIDTSSYVDATTKNNLDLVKWAENAASHNWGYVYGTYGSILTNDLFTSKCSQYPSEVGKYKDFIEENYLGRRTCDCIGLIKGYSWFDAEKSAVMYATNGMPDCSADGLFNAATEKGTIDTIPEIPGLAVWHEGHIGVYVGDGYVVQAANTKTGVVKTKISSNKWTHWLKIPYIEYLESEE